VDDVVDVGVLRKDVVQLVFVGDVGIVQFWPDSGQQLNTIDCLAGRVAKVVDNDDFVSRLNQGQDRKGPNVARPASSCQM
jgi:hypothetical protein